MPRAFTPGPHSRLLRRGAVNGRSREGRYLATVKAELSRHVGGQPNITQAILIERIAWLRLYLALFDEKLGPTGDFNDHDRREYLAFSNSLVRATRELAGGAVLMPSDDPMAALHAHLAARQAAEEAA